MAQVILKPGRTAPSLYHHPWVFSGAVDRIQGSSASGDVVEVQSSRGEFIAWGLYNPHSQITVRLVSWRPDEAVDDAFFRRKIEEAVRLRDRLAPLSDRQTARRLVFSESDGLPGLIADQYADWIVVQFLSLGLDQRREPILDALHDSVRPRGIFERSDTDVREKEGLPRRTGAARGDQPPDRLIIRDGGVNFEIDVRTGQKTGHYLDQRDNRTAVAALARGRRVLDAFCYSGGFGIAAALGGADALGGAASVICLDSSQPALDLARRNAELNGCTNLTFVRSDVGAFLREQPEAAFGLIVLDPPAYARSSHNVDAALKNYEELYAASLRLLERGGILAVSCCSQHIQASQIVRSLNSAGVRTGRTVRVIELRGQPPDHPVAANCPETAYLKCLICAVE